MIGLGHVGLPLARLFSTKYPTVGFDTNQDRCDALMAGQDATLDLEVSDELLQDAIKNDGFICTIDLEKNRDCDFYVVAVSTPVDSNNRILIWISNWIISVVFGVFITEKLRNVNLCA